ncbi:hypothetical protein [Streptomyces sp.]|uniref:hypothetical protein n=1 Tax=Streptomyces sp. TaxID=1931 RepID=UPI002810D54A|nr:hypothetical protein [Streptomyces sp.]
MGDDMVLASKWDAGLDLARFLYVGFFSDVPAWARWTVVVLGCGALGYGAVRSRRARGRGPAGPDDDTSGGPQGETRVRQLDRDQGDAPDVGGSEVAGQGRAPGRAVAVPRREHEEHR